MNLGDRELGIGEDKGTRGRRNDFGGKTVSSKTLAANLFVFIERGLNFCFNLYHPYTTISYHNI